MSLLVENKSQLDFLWDSLVDREYGGVLTSVDANGADFICDDKRLEDQALALLAFAGTSRYPERAHSIAQSLLNLRDPQYPGYLELTDRYWRPHAAGFVKTLSHQLFTTLALLEYGIRFNREQEVQEAYLLLDDILQAARTHKFARLIDRDWGTVLDDHRDLKTVAAASLVLERAGRFNKSRNYSEDWDFVTEHLTRFVDEEHGGVHDLLTSEGRPNLIAGKRLDSMALAAYALARLGKSLNSSAFLDKAEQILEFIHAHMLHPMFGGYWDRSATDGKVQVDGIQGYYGNVSPFPVLKVSDHAILLLAAHEIGVQAKKDTVLEVARVATAVIRNYTDQRLGGTFLGQGNWFSTPVDPTVPLGRHFWVPPFTPGSFHAGNFAYLPLQQKQALTQAWTGFALEASTDTVLKVGSNGDVSGPVSASEALRIEEEYLEDKLTSSIKSLEDPLIDIPHYIQWLEQTKSGGGYGLTPYRSPLGYRSDRSSQVFSTLHVLADFHVLKKEVEDKSILVDTIRLCQNPDGGFGEQPGHPSEAFTTYCGVLSLHILGEAPTNPDACINYLRSCQNQDGGFGNAPGYRSDVWHTNLSVAALQALGSSPADPAACVGFIVSCSDDQGAYSIHPGAPVDTFSAYRAISSLYLLGYHPPQQEKTANWLKAQQTTEGGFVYSTGRSLSFVGSYHAIAALYLLGELPANVTACKKWMADHQNPDGGFGRQLGGISDTTDEGFICLHSTYMLDNALSRYWVAIVS
ncbi:Cellobiose 2-epimerase [compost metagenome]